MPTYMRGHKARPDIDRLRKRKWALHGHHQAKLPKATAPTYDCVALGIVGPIKDQGQCGSCWDFSGTSIVESAQFQASIAKNDGTFALSEQYTLDCGQNGGCNGDDNTTVTDWAQKTGLPTTADYGPYQASSWQCSYKPAMPLFKIAAQGFCTNNNGGVADTQDIKNCMVAYGPIGCGVDASAFDSYQAGQVMSGQGSNIDHDVVIVGWDDSKGNGGAWKVRNSWGTGWGEGGYCWMEYGAYSIGSEAVWVSQTPTPPVPGPDPGPGPIPPGPIPPGPGPGPQPPAPTTGYSVTIPDRTIMVPHMFGTVPVVVPGGTFPCTPTTTKGCNGCN
jgi:C1A family cysteine protease